MKGLIVFPLIILIGITLLTQIGLSTFETDAQAQQEYEYLYDANGHTVCFLNGTATGEAGYIKHFWDQTGGEDYWYNSTGNYQIYNTPNGVNYDFDYLGFSMGTSLGIIGLLVAVIALSAVVGLKIVGSGIGEFSARTIVIATGLITLWGLFSVLAMDGVTSIPIFGSIFYFVLTGIYAIGMFQAIGGGE